MSVLASAADVRTLVLERLGQPAELPDEFDLLAEGVVDSFGLLELIDELERALGHPLDFETAEEDVTTIGGLANHVATQLESRRGTPAPASAPSPPLPALQAAARPSGTASGVRRLLAAGALGGYRGWTRLRDKLFSLAAGGGFAAFGARSVVQLPVRLKGERRIAIGSGCFVGAGSWLQALGDGDEPALTIGDHASIAGHCVLSAVASVRVGAGVSVARGVYVADHAHDYDGGALVRDGALTGVAPVEIGDGVWLGENVVVLPGVRIGERAVIGANSVVAADVPPYALALGVPARVVRRFAGLDGE